VQEGSMLKSRRKLIVSYISVILLLSVNATSMASEQERYDLAKVAKEIDLLVQQVENIKSQAGTYQQDRIVFHYDDLIRDLYRIKEGISDFVRAELRNGNRLTPLDGRYR
jgi:RAQPRD family integrative conjugative element protein